MNNPSYKRLGKWKLRTALPWLLFGFLLWLTFSLPLASCAGPPGNVADSLKRQLQSDIPDSQKVQLYVELIKQYLPWSTDSATLFAEEALRLSEGDGCLKSRGDALKWRGKIYEKTGQYDEALSFYQQAKAIREKLNDRHGVGGLCLDMGNCQLRQGDYSAAAELYIKAANHLKGETVKGELARCYNNLGIVFERQKQYDKAETYYVKSLRIKAAIGDSNAMAKTLNNIAGIYGRRGRIDTSVTIFEQSIAIQQKTGDLRGLQDNYFNLGVSYYKLGDLSRAINYFKRVLKTAKDLNDRQAGGQIMLTLAEVLVETEQRGQAKAYLDSALAISKAVEADDLRSDIYLALSVFFEQQEQDAAKALAFYKKHDALKDSIFNEIKSRQIAEMEEKYEAREREEQITLLEKENQLKAAQRNMLMGGAGLILIISLVIIYSIRNKLKANRLIAHKNEELHRQRVIELVREQELTTINAMMDGREEERKRIAEDLHDRLGSLLSTIKLYCNTLDKKIDRLQTDNQYQQVTSLLDKAVEEVRHISHDMVAGVLTQFGLVHAIEEMKATIEGARQLRVELNTFGMDERIDSNLELVTYRCIQELMSNIIRHAEATEVTIQLTRRNNMLNVIVEDNGKGFDVVATRPSGALGLKSIASRIEAQGGTFTMDSTPGRGSIAILELEL